jgi:hypothetical protein
LWFRIIKPRERSLVYRGICDEQDINAMQTDFDEIAKGLRKIE